MTNRSGIIGSVTRGLGIGQPPAPYPLKPVAVETKNGVLKEIILDGGEPAHEYGLPGINDAFGVPGIEGIDTPAMHGIQLRTMTMIPANGLIHDFNHKTGMLVVGFNMKLPSLIQVDQHNILGCWDADGYLLAGHIGHVGLMTQISTAIHQKDLALCRGRPGGGIGSSTFRMIRASALSDDQRQEFVEFDRILYQALDTVEEGSAHLSASKTTAKPAEAAPAEEQLKSA